MNKEGLFHTWEGYTEPFRIFGNLYFIGNKPASTHLIDTGDGLILIDPGYPQRLYLVIDGVYRLGFKVGDIKYIVCTHGHYDHIGAARALRELTGAPIFLGKEDADYARGTVDLTWARELGFEYFEAFEPDVLISHGDVITLGNTSITCLDAPGHTPGTKAFFFNVTDGERTLRAAMHGGVGTNSMKKSFLDKYGLTYATRESFVPAIDSFIDEPVDILLGNHVHNNDTIGKGKRITDEFNPFIDPTAWRRFLTETKGKYYALLEKEKEL